MDNIMNNISSNEGLKKVINENKIVLVYFGNETCGVCVDMKPKIQNILSKYPEIKSAYVDVGRLVKVASQNNIFTIPGILVFIEGKETIREARHISVPEIDRKLNRYYELLFS